jgi:hypothetical protein
MGYESESLVMGYYPFIRFSPMQYLALLDVHGRWVFDDLMLRLRDPGKVSPAWAICFCGAAATMPREMITESRRIYPLITKTDSFKDRRTHFRRFQSAFFDIWERVKNGDLNLDDKVMAMVMRDYERWSEMLKSTKRSALPISEEFFPKSGQPRNDFWAGYKGQKQVQAVEVVRREKREQETKPMAYRGWRNPNPGQPLHVRRSV